MFKNRLIGVAASVCVFSLISCNALAQVYAGGAIGSSNANINCEGVTDCKTSSVSGDVFAGYGLAPNWGVEIGYADLSKVTGTVTGTYNQQAVTANYSAKTSAVDLTAVYRTNFERDWAAFVKLGVSRIRAQDTLNGTVGTVTAPTTSATSDSTVPVYGLGFDYRLTAKILAFLSVDRRKVKAYDSNGIDLSFNVTNVSIGAQYAF